MPIGVYIYPQRIRAARGKVPPNEFQVPVIEGPPVGEEKPCGVIHVIVNNYTIIRPAKSIGYLLPAMPYSWLAYGKGYSYACAGPQVDSVIMKHAGGHKAMGICVVVGGGCEEYDCQQC